MQVLLSLGAAGVRGAAEAGLVYSRKEDFVVTLCVQKKKRRFGVT